MNVLCLAIDRLHAGYVGCYGNCWIGTPAFDRLASQSLVFDRAVIDDVRLEELYASYWQGTHSMERATGQASGAEPSLPALLGRAGYKTLLLSDEPAVLEHPMAGDFEQAIAIASPAGDADSHEGACLAAFFAAACESLEAVTTPSFWWLHARALGGPWDAPLAFRQKYADEDEPPPPDMTELPCRRLPANHDPDELLGVVQAYAGQVAYLDECLGSFLDAFDACPAAANTLLCVFSLRGFPLGEHHRLGPIDGRPGGELIHVPWLWRFPDRQAACFRTPALVQPGDVPTTLLELLGAPSNGRSGMSRSLASLVHDELAIVRDAAHTLAPLGGWAITTADWRLCAEETSNGVSAQLYAKPDDRWELNDVADRCADVVGELERRHAQAMSPPSESR